MDVGQDSFGIGKLRQLQRPGPGGKGDGGEFRLLSNRLLFPVLRQEENHPFSGAGKIGQIILRDRAEPGEEPHTKTRLLADLPERRLLLRLAGLHMALGEPVTADGLILRPDQDIMGLAIDACKYHSTAGIFVVHRDYLLKYEMEGHYNRKQWKIQEKVLRCRLIFCDICAII